jgi:hypothetical protein
MCFRWGRPSCTSLLPQSSRSFARPAISSDPEAGRVVQQAPLLRSFAPSAYRAPSVYRSRLCLSRFVPSSPFLTTSTGCSARRRSRISLDHAHGVCCPSGFLPLHIGRPRCRLRHSLLALPGQLLPPRADPASGVCVLPDVPTGCSLWCDRIRLLPVSRLQGTDPLLGFLCRNRCLSGGSRHVPNCQRAERHRLARRKLIAVPRRCKGLDPRLRRSLEKA